MLEFCNHQIEISVQQAMPLGALLGSLPVNLLTGGGRGVMEAVSRHYTQVEGRQGVCIGVLPGVPDGEWPSSCLH
jgi:predicted Rossmann-fold nucleotide-binding protein